MIIDKNDVIKAATHLSMEQLGCEEYIKPWIKKMQSADINLQMGWGNKTDNLITQAYCAFGIITYSTYDSREQNMAKAKLPALDKSAAVTAIDKLAINVEQYIHAYTSQVPAEKEILHELKEKVGLLFTLDNHPDEAALYAKEFSSEQEMKNLFNSAINLCAKNRIEDLRLYMTKAFSHNFMTKPIELQIWDAKNEKRDRGPFDGMK